MATVAEVARRHVGLTQRARREQTPQAWTAASALWHDDIEVRVADSRTGGRTWRTSAAGRDAVLAMLSRPEVDASRLVTHTVRVLGCESDGVAVVEQCSELRDDEGNVQHVVPICFVFDIAGEKISRISIYRNEA